MIARDQCQLFDGRKAHVTVCGLRLCARHITLIRAIAADAGVVPDEELLTGTLAKLEKRSLTIADRKRGA